MKKKKNKHIFSINKIRERRTLFRSEQRFFFKNPHIAGMITNDGYVVRNPYSLLTKRQQEAVMKNEKARLFMQINNIRPRFKITSLQKTLFSGYGSIQDIRETIVGRIISDDPSAGNITKTQKLFSRKLEKTMKESIC